MRQAFIALGTLVSPRLRLIHGLRSPPTPRTSHWAKTNATRVFAGNLAGYILCNDGGLFVSGISNYGLLGINGMANTNFSWQRFADGVFRFFPSTGSPIFQKSDGSLWMTGANDRSRAVPQSSEIVTSWQRIPE